MRRTTVFASAVVLVPKETSLDLRRLLSWSACFLNQSWGIGVFEMDVL